MRDAARLYHLCGLHVVLWDAFAVGVHGREGVLRPYVSLLRRLAVPGHGLHVVLWDTSTVLVHLPEVGLSLPLSLLRRLAVPGHGLHVVLWDALADVVQQAEVGLRDSVPLLGSLPKVLQAHVAFGLGVVAVGSPWPMSYSEAEVGN